MTASTRARPRPNQPSGANAETTKQQQPATTTTTTTVTTSTSSNDVAAVPRRALQTRRLSQGGVSTAAGGGASAIPVMKESSNTTTTGIPQSGTVNIDMSIVHALPNAVFPLPGYPLRPLDAADPLLLLCGKAIASCNNRALTPKELALICSTKYGWTCEGSQPFAVVSAAIRSHLRRAATANPPYPPIFSTYELSSVIPTQDIPCIGIEPEARPVVKRGTFWFLAETVGFSSPFPHRPSTSMMPQALGTGTKQKASTITLSFLSQTKPKNEEKPLTRAQANASTSSSTTAASQGQEVTMQEIAPQPIPQQVPMLTLDSDPLGRGKRKRTLSRNTIMAASPAHLQPIAPLPPVIEHAQQQPASSATSTPVDNSSRRTRQAHRRAFSSGSQDAQRPSASNLKKLKFRLSTLSEVDASTTTTPITKRPLQPQHHSSGSLSSKNTRSSQQPNSKRQRTQSMSVLSSSTPAIHPFTASFPFDNLHLHHSMQIQANNGTLMPIEMHNILSSSSFPSSAAQHQLDLLTSRSAPESNIFSPSSSAAMYIGGPFSRRTSPSASTHHHQASSSASAYRSHSAEDGFDLDDSVVGTPADNDYFDTFDNSVTSAGGWTSNNTSFTSLGDLSLLSSHGENDEGILDGDLQDFHSEMLKNDLDLAFDFSLESLEREREFSAGQEIEDGQTEQDAGHDVVTAEALDLSSLSDDVDGIFDGIGDTSASVQAPEGDVNMVEDATHQVAQDPTERAASTFSSQSTEVDEEDEEDAESSAETIMQDGNEVLLKKALNTTLCPAAAAARYGDALRPGRLLARRMNSASSLIFNRSDLRPATLSRNNSRDVLTTPVPLAELPGFSDHVPPHPIFLYSEEDESFNNDNKQFEDDRTAASSPLTPVIKAEDDGDDFVAAAATEEPASSLVDRSRATSHVSQDSSDSFNAESMYAHTRASSGTTGAGGVEDFEEQEAINIGGIVSTSRSQSSSRVSSLSPRDSFSPQATGLGHPAEWALTPPSEEEHTEEEEKLLDRATLLGPESVGMDDLDDAWPVSREFEGTFGEASAVTIPSSFKEHAATFEPVLSPDPVSASLPPFTISASLPQPDQSRKEDTATATDMDIDQPEEATSNSAMTVVEDATPAAPRIENAQEPSIAMPVEDSTQSANAQTSESAMQVFSETARAEAAIVEDAPAHPQSFLFYPDTPFKPDMAILLTETKILFYSTMVTIGDVARPLLRRVDNDAVDGEALLLSLEGATDLDEQRRETFDTIKKLGNTWVSLDYARELLAKFGGENPSLETFLADDILLSWNEKLVRLGTMLRQRNDLATPVKKPTTVEHRKKVAAVARANKKAVSAAAAAKKSMSPNVGVVTPIAIAPNPNTVEAPKQEAPSTPAASASNKKGRATPATATATAATPARRSARNRGNPNSA